MGAMLSAAKGAASTSKSAEMPGAMRPETGLASLQPVELSDEGSGLFNVFGIGVDGLSNERHLLCSTRYIVGLFPAVALSYLLTLTQ